MPSDSRAEFLKTLSDMKVLRDYTVARGAFTHVDAVRINREFAKKTARAVALAKACGQSFEAAAKPLVSKPKPFSAVPVCADCKSRACQGCAARPIKLSEKDNVDYLREGLDSFMVRSSDAHELDWIASLRR